jgi:hypothetical protein
MLDSALRCKPYVAPDLADPGNLVPAQPLNELLAAANPAGTVLVSQLDPMTLTGGAPNLVKQNLYRAAVNQPPVQSADAAARDQLAWCSFESCREPSGEARHRRRPWPFVRVGARAWRRMRSRSASF